MALIPLAAIAEEGEPAADEKEKKIDYKKLENPIDYTTASIRRGRSMYMRLCTGCHGTDGKSQIDVIADATDLTVPKLYRNGTTEGEIFKSIKEGAGLNMPPYKLQIKKDEPMWHMVNFVFSLWPEDMQPELEDEKKEDEESKEADAGEAAEAPGNAEGQG